MSETSKLFKPPFSLVTIKRPTPKGEFFMRIVNVDGADLKGKDLREVLRRANSQPDLLTACQQFVNDGRAHSSIIDQGITAITKVTKG